MKYDLHIWFKSARKSDPVIQNFASIKNANDYLREHWNSIEIANLIKLDAKGEDEALLRTYEPGAAISI